MSNGITDVGHATADLAHDDGAGARPRVICLMISSLDGSLAPDHWSASPGASRKDWSAIYAEAHAALGGDAWVVGRVTMAEMTRGRPHPVADGGPAPRPHHFARPDATSFAIAVDPSGRLHWDRADVDGDHVVVLLGRDVPDSHLRALAADGVSYLVAQGAEMDLGAMLGVLRRDLGIRRVLLEGGGGTNGAFLAAGLVDEVSLLVAPVIDGRTGKRTVFEHGEAGLAGDVRLSLAGCETLRLGVVHLRYAVLPMSAPEPGAPA